MNNASLGMPPLPVVKAVQNGYESISNEPLHGKHDLQAIIKDKVTVNFENAGKKVINAKNIELKKIGK